MAHCPCTQTFKEGKPARRINCIPILFKSITRDPIDYFYGRLILVKHQSDSPKIAFNLTIETKNALLKLN